MCLFKPVVGSGGLFPSGLPTKTSYAPPVSPVRVTFCASLILFDLIARIFGESWWRRPPDDVTGGDDTVHDHVCACC